MNRAGPIIIIEDDLEDQEILKGIFQQLDYVNKIIYISDSGKALDFFNETDIHPFLILSDINMPKMNGFELRHQIFTNKRLQEKCIPYLFFTTAADKKSVCEAYGLSVQGFFKKSGSIEGLRKTIKNIIEYWQECMAPNQFEV
ncbi:MAG: response regulator [Ginsengibacter sp.]